MGHQDNRKQIQLLIARAQNLGCDVILRKSGHYRILCPNGKSIFCAQTPSDWRGVKRTISRLRAEGVEV